MLNTDKKLCILVQAMRADPTALLIGEIRAKSGKNLKTLSQRQCIQSRWDARKISRCLNAKNIQRLPRKM